MIRHKGQHIYYSIYDLLTNINYYFVFYQERDKSVLMTSGSLSLKFCLIFVVALFLTSLDIVFLVLLTPLLFKDRLMTR